MSTRLSLGQYLALNWLLPVAVIGVALPMLLVALLLLAGDQDASGAFTHGELFVGAANASVTGATVLLVARYDEPASALVGAMLIILLISLPSYAISAYMTTQALLDKPYSHDFATRGGAVATAVALAASLACVFAARPAGLKAGAPRP